MKYLLVVDGFGRFTDTDSLSRVFSNRSAAREYVHNLHSECWDEAKDKFKEGVEWDSALLYAMQQDGTLALVDEYDTSANETGEALGWKGKGTRE